MTELDIFKDHNRGLFDLYIFPLYQRISAEKLRCRPDPRLNSVAWNLWHTTRAEDLGLNRLITRGVQVLDEGHWNERLNLSDRHIGTGMTKAEVSDLSARIDLSAMYEYQQAVHAKTASIVDSLTKEALAEKLDADLLPRSCRTVNLSIQMGGGCTMSTSTRPKVGCCFISESIITISISPIPSVS
jgi:hypothetical protein